MILVTGASGRLGGHVVRALTHLGVPVRALVRSGSEYFWLNDSGCQYFFGDLRSTGSLERAVRGVSGVIAVSGIDRETRANNHLTVTVEGHRALWQACAGAGVTKVVYVSALGAERRFPVAWFDAKRQAEQALFSTTLSATVLRPAPTTRMFMDLARSAGRRLVVVPGPGNNLVAPVALTDLALAAVSALDDNTPDWLDLVGPEVMTAREALDLAIEVRGQPARIRYLPSSVGAALGRAVEPLGRRWRNRLEHRGLWFSEPFAMARRDGFAMLRLGRTSVRASMELDLAEMLPREEPDARFALSLQRRLEPTVYEAGELPLSNLPDGPLRYD
jgi:NADH dehydrogenase